MNIVIINGDPDDTNAEFTRYVQGYQLKLHKMGHYVKTYYLRDMKISGFGELNEASASRQTGNPSDDVRYILNALKETDLLVWASPFKQGMISLLTKMVQIRINQYFQDNLSVLAEKWDTSRLDHKIPLIGVILQPGSDSTSQEILLNRLTQERMAANLHTVLSFLITTDSGVTEAICETFRSFEYRLYIENTGTDFLAGTVHETDSV